MLYHKRRSVYEQERRFQSLYLFFLKIPLLRTYVVKIKKRMEVYSPGNEQIAQNKAIRFILLSFEAGFVIVFLTAALASQTIHFILLLLGILFSQSILLHSILEKEEISLLESLDHFLSKVRHAYQASGMIEEAIEQAMSEETKESMKAQAAYLMDTISSEDMEERVKDYMDTISNDFLKEFLALCVTVEQFGDIAAAEGSLFIRCIRNLKNSIHTTILQRKKQRHQLSGYAVIIVIPVYFLPFISNWGKNAIPELERFYNGPSGIMVSVFAFAVTLIAYQMMQRLKENGVYLLNNHTVIKWACEFYPVHKLLIRFNAKQEGKRMRMERILHKTAEGLNTEEFLGLRILSMFAVFFLSSSLFLLTGKGNYPWYYFFLSIIFSGIAWYYPYWMICFRHYFMQNNRADEVMQFQSILFMLAEIPQTTPELSLSWLENFAFLFKPSISKCRDHMASSEEEALEELRLAETYEPFCRIIENLEACDRIGMKWAFEGMESERIYLQEECKQKGEIALDNKTAIGMVLSMVPTFTVITGYLFGPFIIESLQQFSRQFEQIKILF